MSGDQVLVEELLKHGADQGAKDIRGGAEFTPKELAEATGFRHIKVFTNTEEDQ